MIIENLIVSALVLVIAIVFLLVGYWMGRKSRSAVYPGEPMFTNKKQKQGEPLVEYDVFQNAMVDPNKVKPTVEEG